MEGVWFGVKCELWKDCVFVELRESRANGLKDRFNEHKMTNLM